MLDARSVAANRLNVHYYMTNLAPALPLDAGAILFKKLVTTQSIKVDCARPRMEEQ
jgi:hypothetical protein